MKLFHCSRCEQLVYFENTQCVNCGSTLAYLPDAAEILALEPGPGGQWIEAKSGGSYRLCTNYAEENVCNWALPVADPESFCLCCRLNRTIPDLSAPGHREAWARTELAKRRLVYSLLNLNLPVVPKTVDPARGLIFEFLADDPVSGQTVLTGHDEGVIVLNVAEADDAEREKRRQALGEPYRTLIGHFRHEIGHYYWDLLIKDGPHLAGFRERFGDETFSYDEALKIHYAQGAPADWQTQFISSYATMHPWEDWAETWAHYLHMSDTLETAAACGLSLAPERADEPALETSGGHPTFDAMIANWFPLTHVLNNLNRGLGLADGYPFVLSAPVIEKLRFVHEVIAAQGNPAA
jgi:hypothetical protein